MKVLCLPRYVSIGASSRVRVFQYLDFLHDHGIHVDVKPFFEREYIEALYQGRRCSRFSVIRAFIKRMRFILTATDYDLLWYEKELLPWLPGWFERFFLPARVRQLVDYDDAIYQRYVGRRNPFVRWVLGHKITAIMQGAQGVVAGSHTLTEYARQAGAARVHFLPSVVDLSDYPVRSVSVGERFTVGWIGTPITAQKYLPLVMPALRKLAADVDFRLVLIGAGRVDFDGIDVELRDWSLNQEASLLADVDVGIMPLADGLWEQGKCGYKLIQYMACGIPVVASAVGENNYIVREGENGFLTRSDEEWVQALCTLAADPERARAMGLAGRRRVEEEYCLTVTGPRLLNILREAV